MNLKVNIDEIPLTTFHSYQWSIYHCISDATLFGFVVKSELSQRNAFSILFIQQNRNTFFMGVFCMHTTDPLMVWLVNYNNYWWLCKRTYYSLFNPKHVYKQRANEWYAKVSLSTTIIRLIQLFNTTNTQITLNRSLVQTAN